MNINHKSNISAIIAVMRAKANTNNNNPMGNNNTIRVIIEHK